MSGTGSEQFEDNSEKPQFVQPDGENHLDELDDAGKK